MERDVEVRKINIYIFQHCDERTKKKPRVIVYGPIYSLLSYFAFRIFVSSREAMKPRVMREEQLNKKPPNSIKSFHHFLYHYFVSFLGLFFMCVSSGVSLYKQYSR